MVGLVLAAMAVGAGGVSAATVSETTSFQGDAAHSGGVTDPALDGPLRVLWSQRLVRGLSYPLVAGGRAFVLSPGPGNSAIGDLVAIDAATGRELWRRSLQEATDLAYGDGMVYALNQAGMVVALDPATGVTRWANGPSSLGVSAIYTAPVFYDGTFYYNGLTNDEGSSVVALDGLTGAVLWHDPLSTYQAEAGLAADDQGVYLGNECGYGFSFTHAGALRWSTRTLCDSWGSGFGEQTVLADGRVFTDYRSGAVLDTTTGAIIDEFVRPYQSSLPAFGPGHVAVLSRGTLTIADRTTLTTQATYGTDDPDTGELLVQPFFVNDRVFSVDNRDHLVGIDAATATPSADVDLGGQLPPSTGYDPAIEGSGGIAAGGGVIVVATTDGRLFGVTGPDGPTPEPPVDVPTTTEPPTTSVPTITLPPTTDVPTSTPPPTTSVPVDQPTDAAPPATGVPAGLLPPVSDPPAAPAAPAAPSTAPVRATAAAVVPAAARGVGFPAGARLRLVRRGLTLTIAGARSGATVDAVLHAGGRVVWRAHARVPKGGRLRLARSGRAISARTAQLEIRVRAPHATTLVVRRTLR